MSTKISNLVSSNDVETFLLGLKMLPKDFYDWAKIMQQETSFALGSLSEITSRISSISRSDKVWFESFFGKVIVHYKEYNLHRLCYRDMIVILIQNYENFRSNSNMQF